MARDLTNEPTNGDRSAGTLSPELRTALDVLTSEDRGRHAEALAVLYGAVVQEGTVFPAAGAVVRRLIPLITSRAIGDEEIVMALRMLAEVASNRDSATVRRLAGVRTDPLYRRYAAVVQSDQSDLPAGQDGIRADVLRLIAGESASLASLLDHPAEAVRAHAAHVLGLAGAPTGELADRLARAAARDTSQIAAASMTVAVGTLIARHGEEYAAETPGPFDGATEWLRDTSVEADQTVRAAAGVALALADSTSDRARRALSDALSGPPAAWTSVPWSAYSPTAVLWNALGDDLDACIDVLAEALNSPDPRVRHTLVGHARTLMDRLRAAPARTVPLISAHVADEHPRVRAVIIDALAWAGRATSGVADTLANVLDEWAPGGVPLASPGAAWEASKVGAARAQMASDALRETVAAAVDGLARLGDARCLPALTADLSTPQLGLDFELALAGMRAHADSLLPQLRNYLRAGAGSEPARSGARLPSLLRGVASWGPVAAPLVPDLVSQLERSDAAADAALALGHVGPPAEAAVPALRSRLDAPHPTDRATAAWALLRIGGGSADALDVLAGLLEVKPDNEAAARLPAERLADVDLQSLSPGVVTPVITRLRALLEQSQNFWVRAAAARALWRATRDPSPVLPTLVESLYEIGTGRPALGAIAEIGADATSAASVLQDIVESPYRVPDAGTVARVRHIANDEAYRDAAEETLARLGG